MFCFDVIFVIQDCEKMSEKADEVGMGKIFHAAILALNRQDEDSKVPTSPIRCISVGANMADLQRSLFQKCWPPPKKGKKHGFSRLRNVQVQYLQDQLSILQASAVQDAAQVGTLSMTWR